MSYSKKYYRKLKRLDPARAEAYLAKKGEVLQEEEVIPESFPVDKTWYPYKVNYVLVKTRDITEQEVDELQKYEEEHQQTIKEGTILDYEFDQFGFRSKQVVAPVKLGDWYITVEYWVHLTKLVEGLKKALDWEGLVKLERSIPIFLHEFRPANLSSLIEDLFKPPEEEEFSVDFNTESDFDAEQL